MIASMCGASPREAFRLRGWLHHLPDAVHADAEVVGLFVIGYDERDEPPFVHGYEALHDAVHYVQLDSISSG